MGMQGRLVWPSNPPPGALPGRCSNPASFSGRQQTSAGATGSWWSRRVPLKPCRVTNTEDEMRDPRVPLAYQEEMINLGKPYPDPYKEGHRTSHYNMHTRVGKTYIDGLFSDEINEKDTQYWFTEPPEGWPTEDEIAYILPRVEAKPISALHREPGRTALRDLKEGTVMTGTVTSIMYYHGVQVDLGAEYDGLIPVHGQKQWADYYTSSKHGISTGVADDFELDQQVTVRIYKINDRPRCRWPIQLEVLDPDVQHKLTPPNEWEAPFDLRGVRSVDEALAITGRQPEDEYSVPSYLSHDEVYANEIKLKNKDWSSGDIGLSPADFEEITSERRFRDVFQALRKQAAQDAEDDEEAAYGLVDVTEDEDQLDLVFED